jgi:plasmid maintenance system antidote protein VapI
VREYHARLLRKKFANTREAITDDMAQRLNKEMELSEDSMQFRYDDESYHSYVAGKQLMWEKRIDSCLKSTEAYASPFVKPGSGVK